MDEDSEELQRIGTQTELQEHAGLEVEVLDASFIDTSFGYAPAGGVPDVGAAASGFEVEKSSGDAEEQG